MTYKLAKQLKEAGYPDIDLDGYHFNYPHLEELIDACVRILEEKSTTMEKHWFGLYYLWDDEGKVEGWGASWNIGFDRDSMRKGNNFFGKTPQTAVSKLWLALNKH